MKRTYIRPAAPSSELHAEGQLLKSSYIPVSGNKTDHYDAPRKRFAWDDEPAAADTDR